MAFHYSPNIITDGLVLYLDAANTKSYISGSTTWNDISRGGNNGVLTNGPTFNGENGGNIVFDGVDDYSITNLTFSISTNNRTFEVWVKINNSGSSGFYSILQQNISFNNGLSKNIVGLQKISGGSNIINPVGDGTNVQAYTNGFDPTPYQGKWVHIVGTIQGGVSSNIYLNGILVSTEGITINPEQTARYVMTGYQPGYNMNMGLAKVYNRALSSQEISQNYNTTKSRFGL